MFLSMCLQKLKKWFMKKFKKEKEKQQQQKQKTKKCRTKPKHIVKHFNHMPVPYLPPKPL